MNSHRAATPSDFSGQPAARAQSPSAAIEQAAVSLSKGTWGTLGTSIGTIVLAAVGWANSLQGKIDTANTNLTTAISKVEGLTLQLSSVTGQLKGLERRLERYEDRLESVESGQRAKGHRVTKDTGEG